MKSELFGFPADVVSDMPSVKLSGNTTAEVINHKGLKECGSDSIFINTKLGILSVLGSSLVIKEISGESMKIEGNIKSIAYK